LGDYIDDVKQKLELTEAIKRSFSKIGDLPEWMQTVLLEDINATIENRVRTMEMIIRGQSKQ
jgi:hypothetical protein